MINLKKYFPLLIAVLLIASLLVFYTGYDKESKTILPEKIVGVVSFENPAHSLAELNKIAALAAIGLISLAFVIGPLSRIWPNTFSKFIEWRLPFGLMGLGFALAHSAYSTIVIFNLNMDTMIFSNPKWLALITAIISLVIFSVMGITSLKQVIKKMGYKNWKRLQRTGYIALALVIIHFVLIETKPGIGFDVRPYGYAFLIIAIIAIVLKVVNLGLKYFKKK